MKIGMLGTGGVGRTLAAKLTEDGYEVMIGTRNPAETLARTEPDAQGTPPFKTWQAEHPKVSLGTFAEAAGFGDVIFLATPGMLTPRIVVMAGTDHFAGKIVVDLTNPLDFSEGIPPKFAVTLGNALGEQIQRQIPDAKVVKAFNTIGAHIMVSPRREQGVPDLLIAGNDAGAKQWIDELARSWGASTVDMGGIENAYWLEAHAMTWILYAFRNDSWNHAFKFLRQ